MKKILITTSTFDLLNFKEFNFLIQEGFEIKCNPFNTKMTEVQISDLIDENVVAIIAGTEPLTETVLKKAVSLKFIVRCGIGIDNIDLIVANKLGIKIFNTPDAPTRSVAELTIAHILSLLRRVSESDRMIRANEWKSLMGSLLYEQTVGVFGYGRIGKMVTKLLIAFGAKVLVFDIFSNENTNDVKFVNKEQILKESDIITLHMPYNRDNHHFIDETAFSIIKTGAFIVNVSRGGLIDDKAMYKAINEKKIAGAALDCFEQEPYNGPLIHCDNVLMTAHMGSYAKQSRIQQERDSCNILYRELKLNKLINE
jgi:D-3-phosphoglycerate dehydrogenase